MPAPTFFLANVLSGMKPSRTPPTGGRQNPETQNLKFHAWRYYKWTSRRALIEADIRPKSKGSPARYTWQTILVLRVALTLRERFHVELQAHKPLFDSI